MFFRVPFALPDWLAHTFLDNCFVWPIRFGKNISSAEGWQQAARIRKAPSPKLWWMRGTFAKLWWMCQASCECCIGFVKLRQTSMKVPLKTLTSLNNEAVRLLFLGDNIAFIAITAFGGTEGYFRLAIIAFGTFESGVPKSYYRLEKWCDMWFFTRDTGKMTILKRFLSEWPFSLYRVEKIAYRKG